MNPPASGILPGLGTEEIMSDVERPEKRKPLTFAEVHEAYESLSDKYPPILSLKQAAEISLYTESTLKKKLSEGDFRDAVSRGKPIRIWRDRFVLDLMNRPWSSPARPLQGDENDDFPQHAGGDDEVR
jgi:hypothetical protein